MVRNEDIVENLWDVRSLDEARSGEIPIGSVGSKTVRERMMRETGIIGSGAQAGVDSM